MKKKVSILVGIILVLGVAWLLRPAPLEVETAPVERRTVREFVLEEAKTRLAHEYIASMPFSGTVARIELEVGDAVEAGDVLAQVDPFPLTQELRGIEAAMAQAQARIQGVDVEKPQHEDIEAARMQMLERRDQAAMAVKEHHIARVNAENARSSHARYRTLFERGSISRTEYEEALRHYEALEETQERAALAVDAARKAEIAAELGYRRIRDSIDDNEYQREVLHAELDAHEARKKVLQRDLEDAAIRSPIGGYILEKHIEDRQWLAGGTPLLTLGNPDSIEIESDILSEEIGGIYAGAPVEITGRAVHDQRVPGEVSRIYPAGFMKVSALGIEQQRVRTIIAFDNSALQLRPGVRLDVHIVTGESPDTLAVPDRAVFRLDDSYAVFAIAQGNAVLTPVELGLRNDDWAEIREGLEEGQQIILTPGNELDDGVAVRPR